MEKVETIYLKEAINKARFGFLKQLEEQIEFLDIFSEELKANGLDIKIANELGFDPKKIYRKEDEAIKRAEKTLEKIKNGTAKQPGRMENVSYTAMKSLHHRINDVLYMIEVLPYDLEKKYGYEVTLAVRSAELKYVINL